MNDTETLNLYRTAKEQGHPDPVGFVARSDVLSKLDPDFADSKKFGITGLRLEDVERIGITDAGTTQDNINAAIQVDIDNHKNFKRVGDMHVAYYGGGEAVANQSKRPKKFMRDLNKAKKKWGSKLRSLDKRKELPQTDLPEFESPEIIEATPTAGSVEVGGDATRVQEVRSNASIERPKPIKKIPKKVVAENKAKIRSYIREALRSV